MAEFNPGVTPATMAAAARRQMAPHQTRNRVEKLDPVNPATA
jgi:hypothetical protein